MARKNICFLASNISIPLELAKMAKISQTWQPWIKAKVFDFFPLICYEKKAETFFSVKVKRTKIQTMARKHTHSDQIKKVVVPVINEPSAIFLLQQNRAERARFARYPKKTSFIRQRTILATRSNLKIVIILSLVLIIAEKEIFCKEKWVLLFF